LTSCNIKNNFQYWPAFCRITCLFDILKLEYNFPYWLTRYRITTHIDWIDLHVEINFPYWHAIFQIISFVFMNFVSKLDIDIFLFLMIKKIWTKWNLFVVREINDHDGLKCNFLLWLFYVTFLFQAFQMKYI
jgi:hypothetical protein